MRGHLLTMRHTGPEDTIYCLQCREYLTVDAFLASGGCVPEDMLGGMQHRLDEVAKERRRLLGVFLPNWANEMEDRAL